MVEFPVIPALDLPGSVPIPEAYDIPAPPLELPEADMPYYKPMFVPEKVKPLEVNPGELEDLEESQESQESSEGRKEQQQTKPLPLPQNLEQNTQNEETFEIEGINQVDLWGITVPMPKPEIMVAAGATATASVAATLSATWLMKRLVSVLKPALKQAVKRVQKLRKKEVPTWSRERLAQRHYRQLNKGN